MQTTPLTVSQSYYPGTGGAELTLTNKTPSVQEVRKHVHTPGLIKAIRKVWDHDRALVIGTVMNIATSSFSIIEGWNKTQKSRKEAIHILQAGIIGLITTLAQNIYTIQRIEKSNFNNESYEKANSVSRKSILEEEPDFPTEIKHKHIKRIIVARTAQAASSKKRIYSRAGSGFNLLCLG